MEKRGIKWEDCKLSFYEDLTRELAEKRKAFIPVKRRLHELNVRHRLVYPATLIFTGTKENIPRQQGGGEVYARCEIEGHRTRYGKHDEVCVNLL